MLRVSRLSIRAAGLVSCLRAGLLVRVGVGVAAGCAPVEEDTGPVVVVLVDDDGDGWALPLDCDDTLVGIHPGASERCNGSDDDCDGQVDDHPADGVEAWLDLDRDGWGDPSTRDLWCGDPEEDTRPWVTNDGDCDDGDHTTHPASLETCAEAGDEDCDGGTNDPGAIGCVPWYEDRDGDGVGIESARCLCEAEGNDRAPTSGDCDDGDPARVDTCGLHGAYSLGDADIAIVGGSAQGGAGTALAAAGDPDGDGWPDLLLAGIDDRTRPTWWLVRGPFDGDKDLLAPSATFQESILQTTTTLSASGGVDLDGDIGADLVLAGYGRTDSSRWAGFAYVVSGGVSGAVDLANSDAWFEGPRTSAQYALHVAASPDTDGNGVGDLLVGGAWSSAVWLFPGPVTGVLDANDALCTLAAPGAGLGLAVAAAGDTDGDGLHDVLAGAPTAGSSGQGAAWLVAGGVVGFLGEEDVTAVLWGTIPGGLTGQSVAGPGDIDGDGYDDLLVGGPAEAGGVSQAGSAWLVHGPVSGTVSLDDAVARLDGIGPQDNAFVVTRAGDIDADGAADLLVGAPGSDLAGADAGMAVVYYGPVTGVLRTLEADVRLYGLALGDSAGAALAGAGDLDLDGHEDIVIGVPGLDFGDVDAGGAFVVHGGPR